MSSHYKIIGIIHARMTSSRLPGKVMKKICDKSVLFHHYERLAQCEKVKKIYLATSKNQNNAPLIEEAKRIGIAVYAGSEEDVVERYVTISKMTKADAIVRTGCDKPLFSYEVINAMLEQYNGEDLMFIKTPLGRGVGSEIVSAEALKRIHKHYHGPAITKYITEYPHLFDVKGVDTDDELSRPEFRLTLDTQDDLDVIKKIYNQFYAPDKPVDLRKVYRFLDDNPTIANLNRFTAEKEINTYIRKLEKSPVLIFYRTQSGKFIGKNRMGEIIRENEFEAFVKRVVFANDK